LIAELEGREALARALAVDVPESWPPELYDAAAIRYTLAELADGIRGYEGVKLGNVERFRSAVNRLEAQ